MQIDHLVRMANQIGDFFEAMPDRDVAIADIAEHLKRFWAPSMRDALLDHVEAAAGEGLAPLVLEALRTHGGMIRPVPKDTGLRVSAGRQAAE